MKLKKMAIIGISMFVIFLWGMCVNEVKAETIRGSEESVSWIFDSETGVITFSGSGKLTVNWENSIENSFVNVKKIIVEDGITKLEQYAFGGCNNVENIDIPDSVTYIGVGVFSGCKSMQSIKIPDNITEESESLVSSWFSGCESLTDIIIGKDNKYLCCENNVIFNKDKTKLLWYNGSKKDTSYIIPNTVSVIGSVHSHNLIDIQIPNSVTTIESGAFSDCVGLKKVIIPNSVTSIGTWAFGHCTSLEKVIVPNSVTSLESGIFIYSDDCKIYCKSDSKMKTYAEENKLNYEIDDIAPMIELKQNNNTIEVTASDEGAGLAIKAYSLNGTDWQESNIFNVTENKNYTIYVRDALDNIANKSININIVSDEESEKKDENNQQDDSEKTSNENKTDTEDDKNNNTGNEEQINENTQTPSKLPNTGTKSVAVIIAVLGIVAFINYKKIKKNQF